MKKIFLLFVGVFFLCTGLVQASNITIPDLNSSTSSSWYGSRVGNDDEEVEPGMETGQKWDLEGFFLNGTTLSLVGGYDFKIQTGYTSGDIFIDINRDAVFGDIDGTLGNGFRSVSNTYGYDYVLDLNWTTGEYDVYAINSESKVTTAYYNQNQGSSPWQYSASASPNDRKISTGTIGYSSGTSGDYYGDHFGGQWHNELMVDLGFLPTNCNFFVHYTMGCGNDNIMGKGIIPNPEPATMFLMGFGLLGVAGLGRRKLA